MSTVAIPSTPQRPLPGAFLTTPAPAPSIFAQNTQTIRQQPQTEQSHGVTNTTPELSAIERAAKTINDTLIAEARFPALEDYIQNGVTSDYELPRNQAWHPFQSTKTYDFPSKILEQANQSSIKMSMGMFAPLGHAWATIDNCLYLWDYTMPNPVLIGFEENKYPIEAVKLVAPKPGIFVKDITHVIVVATTANLLLLGIAPKSTSTGAKTLTLYTTKMSIAGGSGVQHIESTKSGRIFFTDNISDDIYEFEYYPSEGWFSGRTARRVHSRSGSNFATLEAATRNTIGSLIGSRRPSVYQQVVVDDSRNLIYALGSGSDVQVWLINKNVTFSLSKSLSGLLQASGHFTSRTELLTGQGVHIVSISAIPASESTRICLVATTNTGCRLYITLTRGYGNGVDAQNPPNMMAITHVRLPPAESMAVAKVQSSSQAQQPPGGNDPPSQYLLGTNNAFRLPPGYTLLVLPDKERNNRDRVFCLSEDTPRLKNSQDTSALTSRFVEFGQWIALPSLFTEMQVLTPPFAAATTPVGFGNELAVQFDRPTTELGIMTASGIQIIRRRRLVDMFAALMRHSSSDEEGIDGDIKRFVRSYGRGETAATALAVACGQGLEVTPDSRVASVTDPDVLDRARTTFIEHGGKAEYNANAVMDGGSAVDSVRPSPRHEGLALYISRLVRSIWRAKVVTQQTISPQPPTSSTTIPLDKLRATQKSLSELQTFLEKNRSFIEGLAGPQALGRLGSRQDEIALQGEHRAMNSLMQLVRNVIEGMSFALVLFDERIDDILPLLSPESRQRVLELTYESLFVTSAGRELAKELVKAIVNRNIANGSNVDTVAEALRRRCGSFCSAEDVIIFKAQEQVKKAQANGTQTETGRALLNESERYFRKVAASLSMEHLQWAVEQYVQAQFWAGAVQLSLAVAKEKDRADLALGWLRDGRAEGDDRQSAFDARKRCYDLIFKTIQAIDDAIKQSPDAIDDVPTVTTRRRAEANQVIDETDDTVFQSCLYDWYLQNGQASRLLDVSSSFVTEYLERRSQNDQSAADLLWTYHVHGKEYLAAAEVQLELARGFFTLSLQERIAYLSRAHTNATMRQASLMESRQSRQQLLRTIDDLLEVASIQDDILQRIKSDARLPAEKRPEVLQKLDGRILDVEELFNGFADQAGYHDICLLIYQCADHRNPADIRASWQALIEQTDREAQALYGKSQAPWEAVGTKVLELGKKLHTSEAIFPINTLFLMLEKYAQEARVVKPPENWVVDVFLGLDVPYQSLLPVAEQIFHSNAAPFTGSKRRIIAGHIVYLLQGWLKESFRKGERVVFGSEENATIVDEILTTLLTGDNLTSKNREDAQMVQAGIRQLRR